MVDMFEWGKLVRNISTSFQFIAEPLGVTNLLIVFLFVEDWLLGNVN